MSVEDRTTSAIFKRQEQLRRWEQSATNLEDSEPKLSSRKIQFSSGCVFLAACAASDREEVLRLLDEKADIDTCNVDGLTALHQACIDNNLEMVEFLVEHGADVNRGDNEGWTPLHATASCGFLSIAKYLIEHGADVAAVNNDGELPLDIAESSSMEDILQEIIDQKGIDCDGARNREERLMLDDALAWLNGNSESADPMKPHPKTGATAFHVAAAKGYIKVLKILLQGDPDVDVQDLDGWTPLHAAAHWSQKEAAQLLIEHFCDMDLKNYVGQTAMDVADNQMVEYLQELRTKQAALQKDRPPPNHLSNRGLTSPKKRSSITRSSVLDKTSLITKDASSERQILDRTIREEPKIVQLEDAPEKEDLSTATDDSQVASDDSWTEDSEPEPSESDNDKDDEKRNRVNRDESARINDTKPEPELRKSVAASDVTRKTIPEAEEETEAWRRPAPVRQRGDLQPPKNLSLHIEPKKPLTKIQPAPTRDVVIRRTHSFEADQTFYHRYMELQRRIANSCDALSMEPSPARLPTRSASLRERHVTRRGLREEGVVSPVPRPSSTPNTFTTTTITTTTTTTTNTTTPRTIDSPPAQATVRSPVKGSTPVTPTTTPSPAPSTPTTPGGSKLSPGNIFKNFFKSFVPPVRDEESETQRKAHAKRARETRRSTQGVTLEDVKSAEQLVKKKNQTDNPSEQSTTDAQVSAMITAKTTTVATPATQEDTTHERRPSWRLRVDSNCKFLLEDARNKVSPTEPPPSRTPRTGPASPPLSPPTSEPASPPPDVAVTLPRPRAEEPALDGHASTQSTQAVILRRRKPKRRSTGVVHVDMDEIDPDRQDSKGEDEDERIQNNGKSEDKSLLGSVSSLTDSQPEENGEVDYKKLYEAELAANERLRETLRRTEEELTQVKNAKTPASEAEKRERRAMERKLSEMEEELKLLEDMKVENQRLKDENGALIRVISKLSK